MNDAKAHHREMPTRPKIRQDGIKVAIDSATEVAEIKSLVWTISPPLLSARHSTGARVSRLPAAVDTRASAPPSPAKDVPVVRRFPEGHTAAATVVPAVPTDAVRP
jgi:hypothetical protein